MKNYYDILGLSKFENNQDIILKAYKDHTATFQRSLYKESNIREHLIELNEAFLVLSDVNLKNKYDYALSISDFSTIKDSLLEKHMQATDFILSKLPKAPQKKKKGVFATVLCALLLISAFGTILRTCAISYLSSNLPIASLGSYIPEDSWNRYEFNDSYSIAIPNTMELRSEYDAYTKLLSENLISLNCNDAVFQQKGLSILSSESFYTYSRVIIQYFQFNSGEVERYNEATYITSEDVASFRQIVDAELGGYDYVITPNFRWVKISNFNAIEAVYKRTGDKGTVSCRMYLLPNYDEMVKIIISYRDCDEALWKSDLEKVIKTFNWQNLK